MATNGEGGDEFRDYRGPSRFMKSFITWADQHISMAKVTHLAYLSTHRRLVCELYLLSQSVEELGQ